MKRFLLPLLVCATPYAVLAQPSMVQSPAYKECIALSNSNPEQALVKADEWLAVDNSIPANHCRAMALFGQKRYIEAGTALNEVRTMVPENNLSLRSFLAHQSASAWSNATRADAAMKILDIQIDELHRARGNNAANAKLTSELLVERAKMNITYGKFSLATRDLDHAVSLTPVNADVLVARAEAFELLGDPELAKADVEAALTVNPNHSKARSMLAKLDTHKSGK